MERKIVGYHLDEHQDWVAELDCGHGQHVRHKPPFFNRSWVMTREGREKVLGTILNCVRCDSLEFPEGMDEYNRTPEFSESNIPTGLLRDHCTRSGVWGLIEVLEGQLLYTVHHPSTRTFTLLAGETGVVVPEMKHHVEAAVPVRFHVIFYARMAMSQR